MYYLTGQKSRTRQLIKNQDAQLKNGYMSDLETHDLFNECDTCFFDIVGTELSL